MSKNLKVVLLGYMTSGKSTIGKVLGEQLKIAFVDLDDKIADAEGIPVSEIFSRKGELFFRKKETEILSRQLDEESSFILSLGGGTPCYGKNLEIIHAKTENTFYLKLNISSLLERLTNEKSKRPLVANIADDDLPEFIGKHLFERNQFYASAKRIIECDGKSVQWIVDEIANKLL